MQYFPWEYCAQTVIKPQENSKMFERYPMVAGISKHTLPLNAWKYTQAEENKSILSDSFIFQWVKRYGFSLSRVNGLWQKIHLRVELMVTSGVPPIWCFFSWPYWWRIPSGEWALCLGRATWCTCGDMDEDTVISIFGAQQMEAFRPPWVEFSLKKMSGYNRGWSCFLERGWDFMFFFVKSTKKCIRHTHIQIWDLFSNIHCFWSCCPSPSSSNPWCSIC